MVIYSFWSNRIKFQKINYVEIWEAMVVCYAFPRLTPVKLNVKETSLVFYPLDVGVLETTLSLVRA